MESIYNKLLQEGGLFFPGPSKGSFIFPPNGLKLWQNIQKILDSKFIKYKIENVKLPTLIPYNFFQKEVQHIQGLSPEFFQVWQVGKKELVEPLILRPTSELLFYDWFRQILRSYQQLPLLYNQWCQVFRAEKNTKPFLRNTEFFWQEGHTLHETALEAQEFTQKIWQEYQDYVEKTLCLAIITGKKSEGEKFAGAVETYTVECLLPDGQCLQLATSHYFGNGFCQSMNIQFQGRDNRSYYPFSTSWGTSTRAIGALAKVHADKLGIILPFELAPVQFAFILIENTPELTNYYQEIFNLLSPLYRCRLYNKIAQADKEGCPFKIILGKEELEKKKITLVRRDNIKKRIAINLEAESKNEKEIYFLSKEFNEKINKIVFKDKQPPQDLASKKTREQIENAVKIGKFAKIITQQKKEFNQILFQKSVNFRNNHIFEVNNFLELEKKIKKATIGLFLIPFCNSLDCERTIPSQLPAYSIRCLLEKTFNDLNGNEKSRVEQSKNEPNKPDQKKCVFCLSFTKNLAFLGRSY